MGLVEIYRREANTEIGKEQLQYEQAVAWTDAYGAMYLSLNKGEEFSRTYISVRVEMQGLGDAYYEDDEDDEDEG